MVNLITQSDIKKALELFSAIHEVEKIYPNPAFMDGKLLMDHVFQVLDKIQPNEDASFNFNILHEAFIGYYATIGNNGSGNLSGGVQPIGKINTPSHFWQLYLFENLPRVIHGAERYMAQPLLQKQDFDMEKWLMCSSDDRCFMKMAFEANEFDIDKLLPKITKVKDEEPKNFSPFWYPCNSYYNVECTWWFPCKGLVRESRDYADGNREFYSCSSHEDILITYNYEDSYFKHEQERDSSNNTKPFIWGRNKIAAEEMKEMESDSIHIKENPKKKGQFFFICGKIIGFVSKVALKAIEQGASSKDLIYVECSIDETIAFLHIHRS